MKDHHPRIAVTEHSLHRGVRPKSRKAVRVIKLKPPSPWRHPRSMPDSPDPATALAPAPIAARSPFGPSDSPTRFREDPKNMIVSDRTSPERVVYVFLPASRDEVSSVPLNVARVRLS